MLGILRSALAVVAVSLVGLGSAQALTVRGYATIITIPVVVTSATFTTEIYIHNPNSASVFYNISYYGGTGTTNAGANTCPSISIGAGITAQYSLATLCPALSPGFGRLYIYEGDPSNRPFAVYARINSFAGDGFSIEGFPIGEIENVFGVSRVLGLKRLAAAPGYGTNCFVGSVGEATTVNYSLRTNTGALLGAGQSVVLAANQFVRVLDIFTAAGAPAGDYTNVRAEFTNNNLASYLAFCTVQNNTTFDADFRIAKVFDSGTADDNSRQFTSTVSYLSGTTQDLGGDLIAAPNFPGISHRWAVYVRHPDWLACAVTGNVGGSTPEIRLYTPAGVVYAGGIAVPSFGETYLGEKSTKNSGANGRWFVEVSVFTGTMTAYTLTCTSGNGTSTFTYGGHAPGF